MQRLLPVPILIFGQQDKIMIDGWTYNPAYLRNGDKVMFIDDIFDSGRTLNHLVESILKKGIPREDIKIAVHDYKVHTYQEHLPIQPDYYCRKFIVDKEEDDIWIHYMSHELIGLTREEQRDQFISKDSELEDVFDFLNKK